MSNAKERLAALRAQMKPKEKNSNGGDRGEMVNKYYPFWNMKPGQRAVIRFLADVDTDNPRQFHVEKLSHTLSINGQTRTVPCLSMYGEDCPICKVSQSYYKADDKINGKKYWRKKQHLAQALIVEDPLPPDEKTGETHVGQVRHIALGYQLYNIIQEAIASEDDPMDNLPYDNEEGYDFVIKKTEQGDYSTYVVGSKFNSRPRRLSEEEMTVAAADAIDLKTLLPRNPGVEKVQAMLDADLNGGTYEEPGREASSAPRAASKPAARDDAPWAEDTPAPRAAQKTPPRAAPAVSDDDDDDVDAMLARINERRSGRG